MQPPLGCFRVIVQHPHLLEVFDVPGVVNEVSHTSARRLGIR